MTQRYKMVVEYDGTFFAGFQRQAGLPTVQGALEAALTPLNGSRCPTIFVAGRTDAGVHATGQVVHVDLETSYDTFKLLGAVNAHLRDAALEGDQGSAVCVVRVEKVPDTFHARFSALERCYTYCILNRRSPSSLLAHRVWHVPVSLDTEAMDQACEVLRGHHDFTTFRSTQCQGSTPFKTLDELRVQTVPPTLTVPDKVPWEPAPDAGAPGRYILIRARSRSFLHHQVRTMVGGLKLVGEGKWSKETLRGVLNARDRRAGPPTAPAHGLYLTGVRYPPVEG